MFSFFVFLGFSFERNEIMIFSNRREVIGGFSSVLKMRRFCLMKYFI